MRRLLLLRALSATVFVALVACDSGTTGEPATAELFADPEVCDLPCEIVLDSGAEPSADRALTYTWDLGEGPVSGSARVLHRFESAGSYDVTVTVSGGGSSSTDTTTVLVEEQPKASATIDEAGGSVSQGACIVTIPADVAPEPIDLELTELPSMVPAAERAIGVGELVALGSTYDVDMPLKPSVAIAISVRSPEAQGVDPRELAWLLRMIAHPVPPADGSDFEGSQAPLADYVLVPVSRIDEDGTAHGEIYDRKRFQLVRLSEPLDAESVESEAAPKALPPSPIVIFRRNPSRITITNFKNAILEGLSASRAHLMDSGGFRGPEGAVVVYVGTLPKDWDAYVPHFDRHTIHLSYALTSENHVKKVVAHEFFHLIQNHHTNRLSAWISHQNDGWFAEGTATWAMDEVYDTIQGLYHATPWTRFTTPLLQPVTDAASQYAYHNVAFWKYAETFNTGIIKRLLEDHYALTHSTLPGARNAVENYVAADYLLSLKKIWGYADFLDFTYRARYLKDFDTSETRDKEIWSEGSAELGRPKEISFTNGTLVSAVAGASENDPVTVDFELRPHGTAEVIQVRSVDISGTLHVRFLSPFESYDARLLVVDESTYDLKDLDTIRDIAASTGDLTAEFSPNEHAYVFVVDPVWNYPTTSTPVQGKIEVWVEDPCGGQPAPDIEVSTEDDLQNALLTMPAGSVIKLAAGSYSPPAISWPINDKGYDTLEGVALVRDLTLLGAGEEATTLYVSGGAPDAYLYTWGNATLRNLTVEVLHDGAFFSLNAGDVSMCNVSVNYPANQGAGYLYAPLSSGSATLNLYETSITRAAGGSVRETGVSINTCTDSSYSPNVVANIYDSQIAGWTWGVSYDTGTLSSCSWTATINTDCKGFSNELFNVQEAHYTSDTEVTFREHCPKP